MNTCHKCGTEDLFYEEKIYSEEATIAYSRNINIQREYEVLVSTEITSDIVILDNKFLLLLQYAHNQKNGPSLHC